MDNWGPKRQDSQGNKKNNQPNHNQNSNATKSRCILNKIVGFNKIIYPIVQKTVRKREQSESFKLSAS